MLIDVLSYHAKTSKHGNTHRHTHTHQHTHTNTCIHTHKGAQIDSLLSVLDFLEAYYETSYMYHHILKGLRMSTSFIIC